MAGLTVIVILGLACLYTLISAVLIWSALSRITGKELRHLIIALFITVATGFFYGLFELFRQFGLVNSGKQMIIDYLTNFVLFAMFVMLVYLSFLARELGKRFGFKHVASKIKNKLESK